MSLGRDVLVVGGHGCASVLLLSVRACLSV